MGARVLDGDFTSFAPLCDAVYYDYINSDGAWDVEEELNSLVERCSEWFDEDEDIVECQFYALAIEAYYDDVADLLDLHGDDATLNNEYQHCGLLANGLYDAAKNGEMDGITIVSDDNGQEKFQLEESAPFELVSQTLSLGSVLSLWIGTTLVRVCKNFNEAGVWTLQAGL